MDEIIKDLEKEIRRLRMVSVPVDLIEQIAVPVYTAAVNLEDIMTRIGEAREKPDAQEEVEQEEVKQDVGD